MYGITTEIMNNLKYIYIYTYIYRIVRNKKNIEPANEQERQDYTMFFLANVATLSL